VLDGQNATFTVKVGNGGPSTATFVTVTDTFSGATFVSATPTGAGACAGTGPITCTWPSLAVLANENITVILKAAGAGPITNIASVVSAESDPNPGDNTSSWTTTITPAADLAVNSVTGAPNPVNAGQSETWQVVIGNNGPDAASNISVNLTLSGGGTVLTATAPGFTCNTTPPASAQCVNGFIAAAATATITVTATAPNVAGVWTLNANANSAIADPNPANNSLSGSVNVAASADIGVIKALSGSAVAGGNAVYNITVGNNGPSDAANVTVDDTPGAGLTLVSVTGSGCVGFPCNIALLPNGTNTTITATYAVASNAGPTVTNTATASSPAADPNLGNNTSIEIVGHPVDRPLGHRQGVDDGFGG